MDPLSGLVYGFHVALTPENLTAALIGALLGTAVGILPGLGPTTVIALLLIPTISLPPETGLIMLGGIYYGTQYGDSNDRHFDECAERSAVCRDWAGWL
jgi:putative tricarboxylic transport membrane protein